ncbi:Major antigen [Aphelenchoides fujianensis]|nr:Major antigen [Aphelenchoides fujianensis]
MTQRAWTKPTTRRSTNPVPHNQIEETSFSIGDEREMSTAQQLQRALEERAKEIQQLQTKLQRAEAEKQRWEVQKRQLESRQPADVQTLLMQKRELQQQLQREESEKMELFTQINKLIGDLAAKAESPDLSQVNAQLEAQLQRLSAENAQLRGDSEVTKQKLRSEVDQKQADIERLGQNPPVGGESNEQQLRDYQNEMNVKNAALESLKLAKPSNREHELEAEIKRLKAELEQKAQTTAALGAQRDELEAMKSKHAAEMHDLRSQLAEATSRLAAADGKQREELAEVFEHVGVPSTSGLSTLKRRISSLKTEATEEANRRRKLDAELDALPRNAELDLSEENEQLRQAASVKEELHTLMLSLRAAKSEVAAKETEAAEWRRRALQHEEERDRTAADLLNVRNALEAAERSLIEGAAAGDSSEVLERLEHELKAAREVADDQRKAARVAHSQRDRLESELKEAIDRVDAAERRVQEAEERERRTKEEERAHRLQADQKRIDDLRKAREEHERELAHVRAEFANEIAVLKERATTANEDLLKARAELEEARRSAVDGESRLRIRAEEAERELRAAKAEHADAIRRAEAEKRETDVRLTNEINRLRQRESQLTDELKRVQEVRREDSTADRQRLEADIAELTRMNDDLRESTAAAQRAHDEEMRNMRDELIENVRRLSDLLEAETKRLQTAASERDRWMAESQKLEKQVADLQTQLRSRPPAISGDSELQAKVVELTNENAALAAELLRPQKAGGDETRRELERARATWDRERAELQAEIEALKKRKDSLESNGHGLNGNPTPKPRSKLNGFSSPTRNGTSEEAANPNGSPEESKLQSELDKQKRLINVLRKKLQSQQIERVHQSRSFCTT